MISKILHELINYFGSDVKRINHALKVYGFAKAIYSNENVSSENKLIIDIASILHDVGIKEAERKYNSCSGKYQEIEGPPIAESILKAISVEKTIIKRVCYLVGNHHSYEKVDEIDFQILIEADFLVNIEEDSLVTKSIQSVKEKYFKTKTGNQLIQTIYGVL